MAEHTIDARILLRYDTLINWTSSSLILKKGEIAIAESTNYYTINETNSMPDHTPPAIGIKVGDGIHYFRELPWVQAVAGDVYSWAKAATPPNASQIGNLTEFIASYLQSQGISGGSSGGGGEVSARLYKIYRGEEYYNRNKYYLQYKTPDSNNWVVDTSQSIDLTDFQAVVDWLGEDVNTYSSLGGRTEQHIQYDLSLLKYPNPEKEDFIDVYGPEEHFFLTSVSQTNGLLHATKGRVSFSNLLGIASIEQGGTGTNSLPIDQVLIGHGTGAITGISIDTQVDNNYNLVPNYAIKAYVDQKTAGLTGAMHYIGESNVDVSLPAKLSADPNIADYDFSNALSGDVITYEKKEFVWTGSMWRLLGDEGSYVIKGSIVDSDVDENAAIQMSKIAGLSDRFDTKVTVIPGKGLSTHDFDDDAWNKLRGIENGAQVNIIEHILLNDVEVYPTTVEGVAKTVNLHFNGISEEQARKLEGIEEYAQVNTIQHIFVNGDLLETATISGREKSINITFNVFTDAEKNKLAGIAAGAQVNMIEHIYVNGQEQQIKTIDEKEKSVGIVIDEAALQLTVIKGAQVPSQIFGIWEDVAINNEKQLQLARIAKTGSLNDVIQSVEEYLIINCGSSVDVI